MKCNLLCGNTIGQKQLLKNIFSLSVSNKVVADVRKNVKMFKKI